MTTNEPMPLHVALSNFHAESPDAPAAALVVMAAVQRAAEADWRCRGSRLDDIVQKALLNLWRKPNSSVAEASCVAYVSRVVTRVAVDEWRRAGANRVTSLDALIDEGREFAYVGEVSAAGPPWTVGDFDGGLRVIRGAIGTAKRGAQVLKGLDATVETWRDAVFHGGAMPSRDHAAEMRDTRSRRLLESHAGALPSVQRLAVMYFVHEARFRSASKRRSDDGGEQV